MKGWRSSTWGEEISLEYGKAHRGYESALGNVRVFGSNGPVGWTDKALAAGPGVILGRKGAYRGVQYSPHDFFVIDTAYYVVPKTDLDMRWLYYAIRYHKLGEIDDGSPIPSTTRAAVYVRGLDVPPKEVQKEIARILGCIDDKIAINGSINQTLEAIAQAIFRSWFIDFSPVKSKIAANLEGRDPLRAAMSTISGKTDAELDALPREFFSQLAATAALFPDEMEDSELGKIPKGWAVKRVGNMLELVYGKALKASDRQEGVIPVYGSGGITGYHDTALVPHGSIIVGRKGTVGSLYWEDAPFFPIDTTYYVRPLSVPMTYCYYALQTLGLEKMNTDAAVPGLNRENVYRLELVQPDPTILQKFNSEVLTMREAMRTNLDANKALSTLCETLLPKLLSGELTVTDMMTEAAE